MSFLIYSKSQEKHSSMFKCSHEGLPAKNNQLVVLCALERYDLDFHCIIHNKSIERTSVYTSIFITLM